MASKLKTKNEKKNTELENHVLVFLMLYILSANCGAYFLLIVIEKGLEIKWILIFLYASKHE